MPSPREKNRFDRSIVEGDLQPAVWKIAWPSMLRWRIHRSLPEAALPERAKIFASICVERCFSSAETGL